MASPTKQPKIETETLSGFIHQVSPIKFSATSSEFFNAVIQTDREEFHDAVVFSPGKRQRFLQAQQNGTPLRLTNVRKTLSLKGTSDYDVLLNYKTDVTVTTVPFAARHPPADEKTTLREVSAMPAGKTVSLVECKVFSVSPSSSTVKVRGTDREVRSCRISDGTAELQLQLWEKHIEKVQNLKSYAFSRLSTRVFNGKVQLTTTLATECTVVADLPVSEASGSSEDAQLMSVAGAILALEIRATMKCPQCGSRQDTFKDSTKFHRCQNCRMMQKGNMFLRLLSGTIKVAGQQERHTLSVSNRALEAYIKRYNLQSLLNVEEIEEHFLEQSQISVSFDNELRVIELLQPDTEALCAAEEEATAGEFSSAE
ncbi:uncharacterized protein LOC125804028 [Astyanax mexicanus]|uniref:uncharacterized protein LOC125801285 n=1 Tax=Astyanax mexicanus TaxID=7994 RepID=UPI0020CB2411|nr:uncharacterized protein LOC125801285 [Astyanax mexicanus]XP_049339051.1 uncharacterized protein LOC125804011 [Astyanax mexicanus]XP_049339089.1 uncharacterized protein LOC125804026 [Astyanax mexicanus]XP_049339091.1 uncharacterized protein LOC125804028 [Astyanax mexicanus]